MDLLARLIGEDSARQFRERLAAAAAAGQAAPRPSGRAAPPAPARPPGAQAAPSRRGAPAAASRAGAPVAEADPFGLPGFAGSDFPTSILGTAVESTPPLLAAFSNRPALLAAIVFSEALAPPVALR